MTAGHTPKQRRGRDPIPQFASREEARFWGTHDLAD